MVKNVLKKIITVINYRRQRQPASHSANAYSFYFTMCYYV